VCVSCTYTYTSLGYPFDLVKQDGRNKVHVCVCEGVLSIRNGHAYVHMYTSFLYVLFSVHTHTSLLSMMTWSYLAGEITYMCVSLSFTYALVSLHASRSFLHMCKSLLHTHIGLFLIYWYDQTMQQKQSDAPYNLLHMRTSLFHKYTALFPIMGFFQIKSLFSMMLTWWNMAAETIRCSVKLS